MADEPLSGVSAGAAPTVAVRAISEDRRSAARYMMIMSCLGIVIGTLTGVWAFGMTFSDQINDRAFIFFCGTALVGLILYGLGGIVLLVMRYLVLRFIRGAAMVGAGLTGLYFCLAIVNLAIQVVAALSAPERNIGGLAVGVVLVLAYGKLMAHLMVVINEPATWLAGTGDQKDS